MTLKDALKLTGAKNRKILSELLTTAGYPISSVAIYKWGDDIPESGKRRILKAMGLYPDLDKLAKDATGDL